MEVIYVDNHILVVHKPAGIPTQTDGNVQGFEDLAKMWIKETYAKAGNVFLQPIHRLDKVASGLVLFARTSKALSRLQAAMRDRQIRKTYQAEVEGLLSQKEATLEHHLEHGDFKAYISPKGKKAVLHYRVLKEKQKTSLLEIDLKTGRYHQIRAQLSAIGHPILGDEKYGSSLLFPAGIALQHVRLELMHPVTKLPLVLTINNF